MVEAPFVLEATDGFAHSPGGHHQGGDLPVRAVQVLDVRKPCEAQAGQERAQRKNDGADQRFLPQSKDGEERNHSLYNCRGSA